jgi:hypothetical protein
MSVTRASKPRSGIYPVSGGFLFVPTEDMWNLHEASKASTIGKRAGLGTKIWYQWKTKYGEGRPWLPEWLYAACPLPADAGDFQPTPAMFAFRQEATIRAILSAAPRSKLAAWRRDSRPHVTEALLSHWRRLYKEYEWFDRWLLRGEDPPPDVRAVTVQEAQRCSAAWDFATFCQRVRIQGDTYVGWLSRGLIPSLGWLKWLFGWPAPAGAFVVGAELQRLRREMGRRAILRALKLNPATIWQWQRGKQTSKPIREILSGRNGADADGWDQLHPNTRQHMDNLCRAARLDACCKRAEMSLALYYKEMKKAEHCGVSSELLQYLKIDGKYISTKSRQGGLMAENFFIPPPDMLKFREEAIREGAKQKVWSLQNLSGFDAWFLDWATPKPHRGKRHLVASAVASQGVDGATTNGTAQHSSNLATPAAPVPTATKSKAVNQLPFVPSTFQLRVLEALENKIRTATQLQGHLGVDRKWLYRGGLNPLMEEGLVVNKRGSGGGYFRPDAPPSRICGISR